MAKKEKLYRDINDLKKQNNELSDLYKEIKKEAKASQSSIVLESLNRVDLDLNYKSVLFKDLNEEQVDDLCKISQFIKEALLDAQELLRKGTEYGVQLALNRIESMINDRKVAKSPFLVDSYRKFESNLWNVIKLREFAYGEIIRLKEKQDRITKSALNEKDSMMRVRYFEDIRVLEKDILRLENEAHQYDTLQTALHSEDVLKGILKTYSLKKNEVPSLTEFQNAITRLERK